MNAIEEDIMEISRKLSKMADGSKATDGAVELVNALESMRMDIDVMTKTRIGMVLNEFRKKTTDDKLAKRCKALIKRWKSLLDDKIAKRSKSPEEEKSTTTLDQSEEGSNNGKPMTTDQEHQQQQKALSVASNGSGMEEAESPAAAAGGAGGSASQSQLLMDVRSKSVQMLLNALRAGEIPDGSLDPAEIAKGVEQSLYSHHKGTGDKYKAALRSRVFNLRDKKNQALRAHVLAGSVEAEQFAVMTTEEMASAEMKKVREKLTKESILDHQMSVQEGTATDMFRCHKCGSKVCTYSQLQTRSADEPMTTFVFCRSCGNRWKFC